MTAPDLLEAADPAAVEHAADTSGARLVLTLAPGDPAEHGRQTTDRALMQHAAVIEWLGYAEAARHEGLRLSLCRLVVASVSLAHETRRPVTLTLARDAAGAVLWSRRQEDPA